MTTQNARVQLAQRDSETLAVTNLKLREQRWAGDTRRLVGQLQDGTKTYEGGYSRRFIERWPTFAQAIAAFGSNRIEALGTKPITLTANTTVPETVALDIRNGCTIALNGFDITILGSFRAGMYSVFTGTGNVKFGASTVEHVQPEWFGAYAQREGDIAVNHTAALQRACKAASSFSVFRTVRFTSGFWCFVGLDMSVDTGCGPVPFKGDDNGRTILQFFDDSDNLINIRNVLSPVTGYKFEDLRIGQGVLTGGIVGSGSPSTTRDGIYAENVVLSYFDRIYANACGVGIHLFNGCNLCFIRGCTFGSVNQIGLKLIGSGTKIFHWVSDSWFDENLVGGCYVNGWDIGFSNCKFFDNGQYNLFIEEASGNIVTDQSCTFGCGGLFPTGTGIRSYGSNCTFGGRFDNYATRLAPSNKAIIISAGTGNVIDGRGIPPNQISDVSGKATIINYRRKRMGIGNDNPYFTLDVSGDVRIQGNNKLLFGGSDGGLVTGYALNTGDTITPPYGIAAPSADTLIQVADDGSTPPAGLTARDYYVMNPITPPLERGVPSSAANTITPQYDLVFPVTGYTNADPTDIGKTVTQASSGASGILAYYDNISYPQGNRQWTLTSVTGTFTTGVVAITSGIGAGNVSVVLPAVIPAANTQIWIDDPYRAFGFGVPAEAAYYVINPTATTFQIALTPGGAAIDLTGNSDFTYHRAPTFQVSLVDSTPGPVAAVAITADGAVNYRKEADADSTLSKQGPGRVGTDGEFKSTKNLIVGNNKIVADYNQGRLSIMGNTPDSSIGLLASAANLSGTGITGIKCNMSGTGSEDNLNALSLRCFLADAVHTTTDAKALDIGPLTRNGAVNGDVTNNYGIFVNSQSGIAANNWAIKTGAGLVEFGDTVKAKAGLQIAEGSNQTMGVATLSSGVVTINTTKVTANSRIFFTRVTMSGVAGLVLWPTTITPGTSFVVSATSGNGTVTATDNGTFNWLLVEPA